MVLKLGEVVVVEVVYRQAKVALLGTVLLQLVVQPEQTERH
jgi:hypothetical protein